MAKFPHWFVWGSLRVPFPPVLRPVNHLTSPHPSTLPPTLYRKVEVSTVHFRQSVVAEFVAMFMYVRVFQGRVMGAARCRGAC